MFITLLAVCANCVFDHLARLWMCVWARFSAPASRVWCALMCSRGEKQCKWSLLSVRGHDTPDINKRFNVNDSDTVLSHGPTKTLKILSTQESLSNWTTLKFRFFLPVFMFSCSFWSAGSSTLLADKANVKLTFAATGFFFFSETDLFPENNHKNLNWSFLFSIILTKRFPNLP